MLPSQVMAAARGRLDALRASLPPGYAITIGGEEEEQKKGFKNLAVVLLISVLVIFLALVVQFRSAVKPLIVFAAIPFGAAGALASLVLMGAPLGFMALLGIISLIGVIVNHQIGGLTLATAITLLLVPVLYDTFVLNLKLVRWDAREE